MTADLGKLVLRVAIGGLMLLHGVAKIGKGVKGIGENLVEHGLPSFIAYGVYVGEVVAPILIILGIGARPAAVIFAFNMVVAIWLAHAADLFHLSRGGGWALELQGLYLVGALAIALLGSGRFSVSRGRGRWD